MQTAQLRVAQWGGAPSLGGLDVCRGGCQLGPRALPCLPSLQAGWLPHATPELDHAATWRYLPSVTLRQHLLFLLFPLDLVGSGKCFSVSALLPNSAPKSCSQQ